MPSLIKLVSKIAGRMNILKLPWKKNICCLSPAWVVNIIWKNMCMIIFFGKYLKLIVEKISFEVHRAFTKRVLFSKLKRQFLKLVIDILVN